MSVKRLTYLKQLLGYIKRRLNELQKDWTHAQLKNYKDILAHCDLADVMTKELLDRAKKYQKRDLENGKKWSVIHFGFPSSLTAGSLTRNWGWSA